MSDGGENRLGNFQPSASATDFPQFTKLEQVLKFYKKLSRGKKNAHKKLLDPAAFLSYNCAAVFLNHTQTALPRIFDNTKNISRKIKRSQKKLMQRSTKRSFETYSRQFCNAVLDLKFPFFDKYSACWWRKGSKSFCDEHSWSMSRKAQRGEGEGGANNIF